MVLAKYSQTKLLTGAGIMAVLAVVCAWLAFNKGDNFGIFLPVMFIGFAAISAKAFSKACGSLTALEHSPAGLVVHTNWRRIVVPWSEYAGISVEGWTYRVSFVPVGRVNYLLVRQVAGGLLGNKKIRLPMSLLELRRGEVRALGDRVDEMALKGGSAPVQAGAPARPVIEDTGPKAGDAGFDPDAAIARYMASRAAQPAEAPVAAAPAPPPSPVRPARPAFGRKGVAS